MQKSTIVTLFYLLTINVYAGQIGFLQQTDLQSELIKKASEVSVVLFDDRGFETGRYCSGTVFEHNRRFYVLTADHCLKGRLCSEISVARNFSKINQDKPLITHSCLSEELITNFDFSDLAVFQISEPINNDNLSNKDLPHLESSTEGFKPLVDGLGEPATDSHNDRWFSVSYPHRLPQVLAQDCSADPYHSSAGRPRTFNYVYKSIGCGLIGGSSGSGFFSQKTGRLVSVANFGDRLDFEKVLSLTSDDLTMDFIKEVHSDGRKLVGFDLGLIESFLLSNLDKNGYVFETFVDINSGSLVNSECGYVLKSSFYYRNANVGFSNLDRESILLRVNEILKQTSKCSGKRDREFYEFHDSEYELINLTLLGRCISNGEDVTESVCKKNLDDNFYLERGPSDAALIENLKYHKHL